MKWNIYDNEPDLVGGTVIVDGEEVDCVRRIDTEAGEVVRLHGDSKEEWHTEADCPKWGSTDTDTVCEQQVTGDEIEVYNFHGERIA